MKSNTYFIVPKNVPFRYRSSTEFPWTFYWVHFIGQHADLLYNTYYEQNKLKCIYVQSDAQKIISLNKIIELLENSFDQKTIEIININIKVVIFSFAFQNENRFNIE